MSTMILKLFISVGLGFLIGLEREKSHKAVGIRTMSLITLGSTIFTLISSYYPSGDPTRVIAQIVTGVGFILTGLIFKNDTQVSGLATCVAVWCHTTWRFWSGFEEYRTIQNMNLSTLLILVINVLLNFQKRPSLTKKNKAGPSKEGHEDALL